MKPTLRLGCPKCPHCDKYMSDSQDVHYSFNVTGTVCDQCGEKVVITRIEIWLTRKPEDTQPYILDEVRDAEGVEVWQDNRSRPKLKWKGMVAAPNAFGYEDDRERWSSGGPSDDILKGS